MELPKSDLNVAMDFWVDVSSFFSKEKGPKEIPETNAAFAIYRRSP